MTANLTLTYVVLICQTSYDYVVVTAAVQSVQAHTDKSPESGKVPFAAIILRTADEALIMFVDSVVGQVHKGCLQIAGLEAQEKGLLL